MLSAKEKRFLRYWDDQKAGGRTQYLIIYTIGWAFILFFIPLATSFVVDMYFFFKLYLLPLWAAIALSILLGFVIALFTWEKNEKKSRLLRSRQDEKAAQ